MGRAPPSTIATAARRARASSGGVFGGLAGTGAVPDALAIDATHIKARDRPSPADLGHGLTWKQKTSRLGLRHRGQERDLGRPGRGHTYRLVGRRHSLRSRRRNPDRLGQGGLARLRRAPWRWARIGRRRFGKGLVGHRNAWHSSFSQGERLSAAVRGYFGSTSRLPPGLPGGGITG